MTTFNRITSSIEEGPRGWYRIRLRYWSSDHPETMEEVSRRMFTSPVEAEEMAIRVTRAVRERLG